MSEQMPLLVGGSVLNDFASIATLLSAGGLPELTQME